MALSCYFNWGELEQHLNSEMTIFAQPQEEAPNDQLSSELLGFNHHNNFCFSDPHLDPFLESQDSFYSDNYASLLPYFYSPSDETSNNLYSLFPEVLPEVENEPYPYPKRQKAVEGWYINNTGIVPPESCNVFIPNPPLLLPEILDPFPGSFATNPPVFNSGSGSNSGEAGANKGCNGGGTTLSAQSMAARQRRRKITEKTQELGKLIPGGQKMNTAEMFQAAFNYIKFLQAQVGILETMASIQENGESIDNQELNPLLGSSLIQEKLYSMEKCLVPQKLVQSLADNNRVQSNTEALKDFQELIGIGG
ncbi:hypothetical protein ACH5RR_022847 [Cinchona calisaya]|uniref:BHLH domain-containing protein n=1 Tax=Cinchona calisaya TaxID=153742 RepID=A0ABD2Z8Z3_9GENT